MRILGIDPGSAATGYGVVELGASGGPVHVAHGILRPPRGASLPARLAEIHAFLVQVIAAHRPELAVVEQVFLASSPRSALVLGQARGAALAAVAAAGLAVREYSAREIKLSATGNGAAGKKEVQAMVRRLLGLTRTPAADAADALAAALCHAQAGPLAGWAPSARFRRGRGRRRASRFVLRGPS